MPDTLHLQLTDEEIKDILRRGFAQGGWGPEISTVIDALSPLVRRFGFPVVLGFLKFMVQEPSQTPSGPQTFTHRSHHAPR